MTLRDVVGILTISTPITANSIDAANMTAVLHGSCYTYQNKHGPPRQPPSLLPNPFEKEELDNIWDVWQLPLRFLYLALVPPRSIARSSIAFQHIGYADDQLPITSDETGYFLSREIASAWDGLADTLRAYITAIRATMRQSSPMDAWPEPCQYGYRFTWTNNEGARRIASRSQAAFYPLIALATYYAGLATYLQKTSPAHRNINWQHNIAYQNAIHPSAGNVLDQSILDMGLQRVGGYIDARLVGLDNLHWIQVIAQFNSALYICWGPLDEPFLPMTGASSLLDPHRDLRVTHTTLEYLRPIVRDPFAPLQNACLISAASLVVSDDRLTAIATFTKFFSDRDKQNEIRRATESATDRQRRESLQSQWAKSNHVPGKKGAVVYEWADDNNGVYTRQRVYRESVEAIWGDYSGIQRHFDPFRNEIDLSHLFDVNAKGDNEELEDLEEEFYNHHDPSSAASPATNNNAGISPSAAHIIPSVPPAIHPAPDEDIIMADPLPVVMPATTVAPSTKTSHQDAAPHQEAHNHTSATPETPSVVEAVCHTPPSPKSPFSPAIQTTVVYNNDPPSSTKEADVNQVELGDGRDMSTSHAPSPVETPSSTKEADVNQVELGDGRDVSTSHAPSPVRVTAHDDPYTVQPSASNRAAWIKSIYPLTTLDVKPIRSTTLPASPLVIIEAFQRYGFCEAPLPVERAPNTKMLMKLLGYFHCDWNGISATDARDQMSYMVSHISEETGLCDLDDPTSEITKNVEAVKYQRVHFEDNPTVPSGAHLLIPDAATMVMILRNKLGEDTQTIAKSLHDTLTPFSWLRDIPQCQLQYGIMSAHPPHHHTLGYRRKQYQASSADWQEYVTEVEQFAKGDRGFAAACAGGLVGRIVHEHVSLQDILCGPDESKWSGTHRHLVQGTYICESDGSEEDALLSFLPGADIWGTRFYANLTWTAHAEEWYLNTMKGLCGSEVQVRGRQWWRHEARDHKNQVKDTLAAYENKARRWLAALAARETAQVSSR
ncbi:hypothetical protein BDZ89DRAFT_1046849 [Hymenopellis radicata]|nr:hypothetical protein BDZ89DRAFT_1046849 [Hymenopellis radicata]